MFKNYIFFGIFIMIFAAPLSALDETEEFGPSYPPQAIINASYMGDTEMVRMILATNPDKDVRDILGGTALHVAMYQQNISIVKLLLDNGFDPNAKATKTGYTPLHLAVTADNVAAARLLLQYGADKRIRCLQGKTPMDKARESDKTAMIKILM